MKMPVTQFWDDEVVYLYGLFGGFIQADSAAVHSMLNSFININNKSSRLIALDSLINLEAWGKITAKRMAYAGKPFSVNNGLENLLRLKTIAGINPWAPSKHIEQIELEIDVLDKEWFRNMLKAYLEVFRTDMIFTPFGKPQLTFIQHRENLLNQLPSPLTKQTLRGHLDKNFDCFIETLFALVLEESVVIEYIDVHFKIKRAGIKEVRFIATVIRTAKHTAQQADPQLYIAEARIDGRQILIGLKGEELIPLGKPLRFQGPQYNFMYYMQSHTNQTVSKHDVQEGVEGCAKKNDMTELVRNCRFDKQLKQIFFDGTTERTVRFTPYKELSGKQLEAYKNYLDAIANKS